MSRVHVVSFCNLIGAARARHWKSTTFPADVTRLSSPPVFEERAGDEATKGRRLTFYSFVASHFAMPFPRELTLLLVVC